MNYTPFKKLILTQAIPHALVTKWHAFLNKYPLDWYEGKTPDERGQVAYQEFINEFVADVKKRMEDE